MKNVRNKTKVFYAIITFICIYSCSLKISKANSVVESDVKDSLVFIDLNSTKGDIIIGRMDVADSNNMTNASFASGGSIIESDEDHENKKKDSNKDSDLLRETIVDVNDYLSDKIDYHNCYDFFYEKQCREVLKKYKKCIKKDTLNAQLYNCRIAECYNDLGRPEMAKIWYDKISLSDMDSLPKESVWDCFNFYRNKGEYKKAMRLLKNVDDNLSVPYFESINLLDSVKNTFTIVEFNKRKSFSDILPLVRYDTLSFHRIMSPVYILNQVLSNGKKINKYSCIINDSDLTGKKDICAVGEDNTIYADMQSNDMYYTRIEKTGKGEISQLYSYAKNTIDVDSLQQQDTLSKQVDYKKEIHLFPEFSHSHSIGYCTVSSNSDILVFSAKEISTEENIDLYYSLAEKDVILCSSKWSTPKKFDNRINSLGNEIFPRFDKDNNLIFSSNGLPGFGGYDLFKAKLNDTVVFSVQNMGRSLNSNFDDIGVCEYNDQHIVSSNRIDGGKFDLLYTKLDINDLECNIDSTTINVQDDRIMSNQDIKNIVEIDTMSEALQSKRVIGNEVEREYFYSIQVIAMYEEMTLEELKDFCPQISNFMEIKEDGYVKYRFGKFRSYNEAYRYAEKLNVDDFYIVRMCSINVED